MEYFFLLITSLSVSIDSFFSGLSLSLKRYNKIKVIFIVAITVFLMCFTCAKLGSTASSVIKTYSSLVGGLILIIISFSDTLKNKQPIKTLLNKTSNGNLFYEAFLIGFSIGLDGALGCMMLTILGFNYLLVTALITFMHVILLLSSFIVSNIFAFEKNYIIDIIPSCILFILGIIKLLEY